MSNYEVWQLILAAGVLLAMLISMAAGYYAWKVSQSQVRKNELADLAEKIDAKARRAHERVDETRADLADLRAEVATNRANLSQLPNAQMVSDLRLVVEELRGDVKSLGKELGGFKELSGVMRRQVELIDGYLREPGKGQ